MDRESIAPDTIALAWRMGAVLALCALWVAQQRGEAGLILVLLLAVLALARWRFPLPAWTTLIDQLACTAACAAFWREAAFAAALPVFECFLAGRPFWALPTLAVLVVAGASSFPLAATLGAAALAGLCVHLWRHQLAAARRRGDSDRRARYELEVVKGELLVANVGMARMAESAERARIARDLHDHAGHEIAAAQLAVEACRTLRREGDPEAEELLEKAAARVAQAMALLRRTVRGLRPEGEVGACAIEEICRSFAPARVAFAVHGDAATVPVHAWAVLEPCLKEALTNAARHGGEGTVDVSLDVGPHIVRLAVRNPARRPAGGGTGEAGSGLRNLSERARAVGGNIATDTSDGFRLVCVLPVGGGTR